MGGPLTNQQRSKEFYRIAYECAESKAEGMCGGECAACTLNVHLYMDDIKDATLIKTSAAVDYLRKQKAMKQFTQSRDMEALGGVIGVILAIVLCAIPVFMVKSCISNALKPKQDVDRTLQAAYYVRDNIRDVDRDGSIDCVDRALLFREFYGPDAKLIWNRNPNTKMNHLFILINGTPIEPYSYSSDFKERQMHFVWGRKFDPRYNRNITYAEQEIRRRTFVWR